MQKSHSSLTSGSIHLSGIGSAASLNACLTKNLSKGLCPNEPEATSSAGCVTGMVQPLKPTSMRKRTRSWPASMRVTVVKAKAHVTLSSET